MTGRKTREAVLGYALIFPAMFFFAVFTFYPFLYNFWLASHRTPVYSRDPSPYVGASQFVSTITSSTFFDSLRSTAIFTGISVPIGVLAGLILAVAANRKLRGIGFFRVVFASTSITGVAVAAAIFGTLFDPNLGLLPWLGVHIGNINQSPAWALEAVAGIQAWQFMGLSFLIMIAGLQSLPEDVIEAARTDGAGPARVFWRVIVPLMSPTIFFAVVVGIILALSSFGTINYLIGPAAVAYTHTNVLINWIADLITVGPNYGMAACVAIALFILTLVVTLVQFRVLEKRVHYGS